MKTTRKIAFSGAIAIAYIISVVGVTQLHAVNTDILTNEAISTYPTAYRSSTKTKPVSVESISRKLIGQVYGTDLASSKVLGETTQSLATLNQEEISDITNPAVVRVFNYVTGTITIPEFDIDLNTLNLVPLEKKYTEKVEELSSGTGFFVDDNGHILTNAHVVDKNMALESFTMKVVEYYASIIFNSILTMSPEQQLELENSLRQRYGGNDEEAAELLAQDMLRFISEFLEQNAETNLSQTVTVLDPSKTSGTINNKRDLINLVNSSLSVEVLSTNKDYRDTQKDVSLLKIDSSNTPTPSLQLNQDTTVNVGQKIYVVGFPANATIDRSDLYSTTITNGTVNSIKDVNGVKVYQTDAKISPGSSGGPALNENGQVIGMMTFLTSGEVGDSFAFAIPIKLGVEIMSSQNVSNANASFANSFLRGMNLKSELMCRRANESFASINNMNALFTNKIELQKYIEECDGVIAAGQSMDGTWESFQASLKSVPIYAWAGGATIVLIVLSSIFFVRRYRYKETEQPNMIVSTISSNSV